MSLIKSVDVPKHMADRLRSRRLAARLSGGAAKRPAQPAAKPLGPSRVDASFAADETPSSEIIGSPYLP